MAISHKTESRLLNTPIKRNVNKFQAWLRTITTAIRSDASRFSVGFAWISGWLCGKLRTDYSQNQIDKYRCGYLCQHIIQSIEIQFNSKSICRPCNTRFEPAYLAKCFHIWLQGSWCLFNICGIWESKKVGSRRSKHTGAVVFYTALKEVVQLRVTYPL